MRTNQIMVDSCDWVVCYVRHGASNSRNLLEYAGRREEKGLIQIINIGERDEGKRKIPRLILTYQENRGNNGVLSKRNPT